MHQQMAPPNYAYYQQPPYGQRRDPYPPQYESRRSDRDLIEIEIDGETVSAMIIAPDTTTTDIGMIGIEKESESETEMATMDILGV